MKDTTGPDPFRQNGRLLKWLEVTRTYFPQILLARPFVIGNVLISLPGM